MYKTLPYYTDKYLLNEATFREIRFKRLPNKLVVL